MPSTGKCPYCGSTVRSDQEKCPNCGASNENFVADTPRTVFLPKTIEELKEYCSERGMPLLKMRFFIGVDFKEPRAFGIYQEGNNFVVYKNKADGSRAVRYRGPNEEYAVNELFRKLLEECHSRGIYPDGQNTAGSASQPSRQSPKKGRNWLLFAFIGLYFAVTLIGSSCQHRNDGYYRIDNGGMYYRYGSDWYYSDYGSDYWYETTAPSTVSGYEDYYEGDSWNSGWGDTSFKDSTAWREIEESNSSSSSDYDSWDSGSTDWDSDW